MRFENYEDKRFIRYSTLWCNNPTLAQQMLAEAVLATTEAIRDRHPDAQLHVIFEEAPMLIGDVLSGYRMECKFGVVEKVELN